MFLSTPLIAQRGSVQALVHSPPCQLGLRCFAAWATQLGEQPRSSGSIFRERIRGRISVEGGDAGIQAPVTGVTGRCEVLSPTRKYVQLFPDGVLLVAPVPSRVLSSSNRCLDVSF